MTRLLVIAEPKGKAASYHIDPRGFFHAAESKEWVYVLLNAVLHVEPDWGAMREVYRSIVFFQMECHP